MFLDASAVVAILTREEGAHDLTAKITSSRGPIYYSSTTVFEAVIAISRKMAVNRYGEQKPTPPDFIKRAQENLENFLQSVHAVEVDLPAGLHATALEAARTYGRFVGHPARLNFGDCFSYAAAKSLKTPLLFVRDDFAKTDIKIA